MLHSFANQRSRNTAIAAEALTHRGVFEGFALSNRHSVVLPAESAVGNPAALAVCRCNPNLHAGVAVIDLQSPFGLEVCDVAVVDHRGLNWIHNNEVTLSENEFWSQSR